MFLYLQMSTESVSWVRVCEFLPIFEAVSLQNFDFHLRFCSIGTIENVRFKCLGNNYFSTCVITELLKCYWALKCL